ncbi:RHS repeat-associated core domain-containing protein, partial [Dysgonomonas sp. 521]|nr:RHS repeat-associated core domain-containing protein [Dysgonomonas sp. 521]
MTLDQIVLSRQVNSGQNYDTYYVYDAFGNLSYVLPPLASDNLTNITDAGSMMKNYAYLYKYDKYQRCISKKIPGCEPIYYVYDKADQLIFSQDGEQRTKSEWTFTIPDALGRPALAGVCKNTLSYTADPLATAVVKATYNTSRTNLANSYTITGVTLSTPSILSANYYDSYAFMGITEIPNNANTQYNAETGYATRYTTGYKGLLTGTATAQIASSGAVSSTYLYSIMYYDNRGRLIQTKSNNHLTGGIEKEYIAYNFTGQPTKKKHIHAATGKTTQTEVYAYTYDHAGRLLKTTHQLNSGTTVTLASNTYDELGRLKTNQKHTHANLKTTYGYNVRSWTKTIASPLFTQTLYYNEAYGIHGKQYNGNISAMTWKVGS